MTAIARGTALEVTAYDRANVTRLAVGKVAALDSQIDPTTGTVKFARTSTIWTTSCFQTSSSMPGCC